MKHNVSDLKPCPFCGKDVACITSPKELEECKYFENEDCPNFCYNSNPMSCHLRVVVCDYLAGGCGTSTRAFSTATAAIKAWNTRKGEGNHEDDLK